ncbi:MAG TPA: hypothetical protein VK988_18845 [Acidimicrobiales bacterium]|nr:hypothetical protein [Acidimicrobiales bacterium]
MRRSHLFPLAVALYTAISVLALAVAFSDEGKREPVAGAFLTAPVTAAVLLFFERRDHRWPKWMLLVLLVLGMGRLASYFNARSLLAPGDVVALVVLLWGWPAGSVSSKAPLSQERA